MKKPGSESKPFYVVSACLAGIPCRFNGTAKTHPKVLNLVQNQQAIPVCPEQLAGLPTPRAPCENKGDRVVTQDGNDLTNVFEQGAKTALQIAQQHGCTHAILRTKSPSCGCGKVFDGSFSDHLVDGDGVFTKLLKKNGIVVKTQEEL